MKPLIKQQYPLSLDFKTAEKIVSEIHKLVYLLKKGEELNNKEYKKLNKITSKLVHPVI
jgi:nitrite reductase/ring-hydroxylating ferredoxin subunit